MSFVVRFPTPDLVVIRFEGRIPADEESRAVQAVATDPRLPADPKILVDRRRARMTVGPQHVPGQVALVGKAFGTGGRQRVAVVVAADYDFGMSRMLELRSDRLNHDYQVFREIREACAWLGVDPAVVETAEPPPAEESPAT